MTATPSAQAIVDTIARMVRERGADKTVCPSEVARALAGQDEKAWRLLMKPIRSQAVRMAEEGRISIRRKGRLVDPGDFKGIYRLGVPVEAGSDGAGSSDPVRPDKR